MIFPFFYIQSCLMNVDLDYLINMDPDEQYELFSGKIVSQKMGDLEQNHTKPEEEAAKTPKKNNMNFYPIPKNEDVLIQETARRGIHIFSNYSGDFRLVALDDELVDRSLYSFITCPGTDIPQIYETDGILYCFCQNTNLAIQIFCEEKKQEYPETYEKQQKYSVEYLGGLYEKIERILESDCFDGKKTKESDEFLKKTAQKIVSAFLDNENLEELAKFKVIDDKEEAGNEEVKNGQEKLGIIAHKEEEDNEEVKNYQENLGTNNCVETELAIKDKPLLTTDPQATNVQVQAVNKEVKSILSYADVLRKALKKDIVPQSSSNLKNILQTTSINQPKPTGANLKKQSTSVKPKNKKNCELNDTSKINEIHRFNQPKEEKPQSKSNEIKNNPHKKTQQPTNYARRVSTISTDSAVEVDRKLNMSTTPSVSESIADSGVSSKKSESLRYDSRTGMLTESCSGKNQKEDVPKFELDVLKSSAILQRQESTTDSKKTTRTPKPKNKQSKGIETKEVLKNIALNTKEEIKVKASSQTDQFVTVKGERKTPAIAPNLPSNVNKLNAIIPDEKIKIKEENLKDSENISEESGDDPSSIDNIPTERQSTNGKKKNDKKSKNRSSGNVETTNKGGKKGRRKSGKGEKDEFDVDSSFFEGSENSQGLDKNSNILTSEEEKKLMEEVLKSEDIFNEELEKRYLLYEKLTEELKRNIRYNLQNEFQMKAMKEYCEKKEKLLEEKRKARLESLNKKESKRGKNK